MGEEPRPSWPQALKRTGADPHAGARQTRLQSWIYPTLILAWTGLGTHDSLTWLMEVTPVIIVVPLLLATAKRYPLTPLLYTLIFFHAIILMVGGQYTYAKVPVGFEVQEWLGLSRNPYDKLGHFFQGLVPALVAREILVRGMYVRGRKMVADEMRTQAQRAAQPVQ